MNTKGWGFERVETRRHSSYYRFGEQQKMPIDTKQGILDAVADMTERLTKLLNTPGISPKIRQQAERALKAQERHKKKIERLLARVP